jgi:thiamine biosynthesis lipoprotein
MIARARALLGTIVSIRADAAEPALDAAFAKVSTIHALMSAHSDTSDMARIGREAHLRPVRVHRWTWRVLACAKALSEASGGAFDVTLGREGASHADIVLLAGERVRLKRRARLDLGGIAKGFAVDRAVAALRRCGASAGSVNAGGDLRIFGALPQTVRVRLPASPCMTLPLASEREGAFATSAGYFGAGPIDLPSGRRACEERSITVAASCCMIADGLTKIVAAAGPVPHLLRRFRARAYLIDREGRLYAARA